ncbi:flavodoxin domain-containing protein [Desulfoglaeba alkanexedens]|jgi:flavorubredoxin|uniref:FprA family A-type flavoprotein n=1 Tax=Desulfoglaeba alkanexedens ALDC TaxID=980445 RepID=A0A4P8L195_9BACT|nr:flavodoxin domain-containing protein [Desulfoglaeba alkanexedens]QCQ21626.1 FprA family A-type flavoprotein [Desulfoglaeba alkanexedens ALDC]
MAKALVVYATRTNQTKNIAELVAEGMRFQGMEVRLVNVAEFDKSGVDPEEFDAVVLGSPTYHGEMLPSMKTFLFKLERSNLEGKAGGAFGAFGWSGEAPTRIFETMKHVYRMNMAGGPLMLKSASLGGGVQMAQGYGQEVARILAG